MPKDTNNIYILTSNDPNGSLEEIIKSIIKSEQPSRSTPAEPTPPTPPSAEALGSFGRLFAFLGDRVGDALAHLSQVEEVPPGFLQDAGYVEALAEELASDLAFTITNKIDAAWEQYEAEEAEREEVEADPPDGEEVYILTEKGKAVADALAEQAFLRNDQPQVEVPALPPELLFEAIKANTAYRALLRQKALEEAIKSAEIGTRYGHLFGQRFA